MSDDLRLQRECGRQYSIIAERLSAILSTQVVDIRDAHPVCTDRHTILLGAVLKAQESGRAVMRLRGLGLSDEMQVILRSIIELVISCCYLQVSSDDEVKRYLHHDGVAGLTALEDFMRADKGKSVLPANIAKRTKANAARSEALAGLKLNKRTWSADAAKISDKAQVVDKELRTTTFSTFVAATYSITSGYVHANYKTLHRHAYYLTTGKRQPMYAALYGDNSAMHGLTFAWQTLGLFMAARYGFAEDELKGFGSQTAHLLETARQDFVLHRGGQQNTT